MIEVPSSNEGLEWIAACTPHKLLLIQGLNANSIIAAAKGDQQALCHLRTTAQSDASNTRDISECKFWDLIQSCRRDPVVAALHPDIASYLPVMSAMLVSFMIDTLRTAAGQGKLAALQWLRALCRPVDPEKAMLMANAASPGHLQVLQYLHKNPNQAPWDRQVAENAREHPECLGFLLSQTPPCPCPYSVVWDLAGRGQLDTLKHLHSHGQLPLSVRDGLVTHQAGLGGHLSVLQWLRSLDPPSPWHARVLVAAASQNDFEMVQWMRQQDTPCPWDAHCTAAAANHGPLGMLRWLRAQDPPCPWDAECYKASPHATLTTMQWLRSQQPPCPWDKSCTASAVQHDRLDLLQWMRQQQPPCPWGEIACRAAASSGNLEILQLVHEQAGPWTDEVYHHAAWRGHMHVLRWLHLAQIPVPMAPVRCYSQNTDMPVPALMLLADIGCPLDPSLGRQLIRAQKAFCAFHGCVRWCRRVGPGCRQHARQERNGSMASTDLLLGLSRLPPELVNEVAVAAELQHDLL